MKEKVYCIKYAMTKGISEHELIDGEGYRAVVRWKGKLNGEEKLLPNEYFYCFENAKKAAEAQRDKKIKLLKEQIKRLENMRFETATVIS